MKETGLMFKAPLVRSILDDIKLMTRRIAKDVKHPGWGNVYTPSVLAREPQHTLDAACPYGGPGDRIYVRETFAHFERNENFKPGCTAYFRADGECVDLQPWRPAIHMPKHAARIWLDITGVRLERLQDISEADCIAEGISELPHQAAERGCWWTSNVAAGAALHGRTPRNAFQLLWESTGGDWAANPWCWVIDFKRGTAQKGQ